MPQRNVARPPHREVFAALRNISDLVLTIKNEGPNGNGDLASVNIHGRFDLFPKHWRGFQNPDEDLIYCASSSLVTASGEPTVHLHVDWSKVNFMQTRPLRLDLINTDTVIVFFDSVTPEMKVFWFYARQAELTDFVRRYRLEEVHDLR